MTEQWYGAELPVGLTGKTQIHFQVVVIMGMLFSTPILTFLYRVEVFTYSRDKKKKLANNITTLERALMKGCH